MGTDDRVPVTGRRVVIVYKWVPQYRRRFFCLLRERLGERGVRLDLVYGRPQGDAASKKDAVEIPWGDPIDNRYIRLGHIELIWQPGLRLIRGADLIVVEQANRLLLNYLLLMLNVIGLVHLAYWGHGRNFQARRTTSLTEVIKRLLARTPRWWFAYNEMSAECVKKTGFPASRITSVENSIDTSLLMESRRGATPADMDRVREEYGISGRHVCIFCGALYEDKRLEFLFEACAHVREQVPDFELLVVGAGPQEELVREYAKGVEWMRYVGPQFDDKKAECFLVASLLLMPGLVGLAVVDSFVMQVPLVTTDFAYHSPEIDYLMDGVNGVIVEQSRGPEGYAAAIVDTLRDVSRIEALKRGCADSAERYTLENMVDRFADGVMRALDASR